MMLCLMVTHVLPTGYLSMHLKRELGSHILSVRNVDSRELVTQRGTGMAARDGQPEAAATVF